MAKVLRKDYENTLDVLADMVNHAKLADTDIAKERTVVLEEIKMYYDLPMHYVQELLMNLLWPNQSLGNFIAGTVDSVIGITPRQLRSFKKKYYHPKNIVVTVFGDVSPTLVEDQVTSLFGKANGRAPSRFTRARSNQRSLRTRFEQKKTEQTHFVMGLHCGSRNNPDRYKIGLLNIIMGGNMSSRLFEQVREQRGLAYTVRSHVSTYQDAGAFTISAGVDDRKTLQTIKVIMRELNKICEKRVGDAEFRRAKDYFLGQLLLGLEDGLDHMLWMGEHYLYTNRLPTMERLTQAIEEITPNDIRRVARKLIWDQPISFALIGPTKDKVIERVKKELKN